MFFRKVVVATPAELESWKWSEFLHDVINQQDLKSYRLVSVDWPKDLKERPVVTFIFEDEF